MIRTVVVPRFRNSNSQTSAHKLLQERIENANPRRTLTTDETKRLNKLEGVADKLKCRESIHNH